MAKFSGAQPAVLRGPVQSAPVPAITFEGGLGWERDARSELFLAAVTEMAEDKFYEAAPDRRARIAGLVKTVLAEADGADWLRRFVPWLRGTANMRSAAVILAAEYAAAGGPRPRGVVDSACARADEPAELLGYWLATRGRAVPAGVKRGLADACRRLYTERNALKYDGGSRGVRMGDVVELAHPKPRTGGEGVVEAPWQSALFRHLIDRRHNRAEPPPPVLGTLALDYELQRVPIEGRRAALRAGKPWEAAWSWERLAGWLPGGMDAEAWEAVVPHMGYMALLRNLRNLDEAGVSDQVKAAVAAKLVDPDEVAGSRQFPYRFLSAWKALQSLGWGGPLERALDLSCRNVPEFTGRTLVLIDVSQSMDSPVGASGPVRLQDRYACIRPDPNAAKLWEVAALFGTALARRHGLGRVDVGIFAETSRLLPHPMHASASVLRAVENVRSLLGSVGWSTYLWTAMRSLYAGHDRVVVLTDDQAHDSGSRPEGAWLHMVNVVGYHAAAAGPDPRTFHYGGFTDALFGLMPRLEAGRSASWPF